MRTLLLTVALLLGGATMTANADMWNIDNISTMTDRGTHFSDDLGFEKMHWVAGDGYHYQVGLGAREDATIKIFKVGTDGQLTRYKTLEPYEMNGTYEDGGMATFNYTLSPTFPAGVYIAILEIEKELGGEFVRSYFYSRYFDINLAEVLK
jgi:hypothetical protein